MNASTPLACCTSPSTQGVGQGCGERWREGTREKKERGKRLREGRREKSDGQTEIARETERERERESQSKRESDSEKCERTRKHLRHGHSDYERNHEAQCRRRRHHEVFPPAQRGGGESGRGEVRGRRSCVLRHRGVGELGRRWSKMVT